jgi:hypothetical protein
MLRYVHCVFMPTEPCVVLGNFVPHKSNTRMAKAACYTNAFECFLMCQQALVVFTLQAPQFSEGVDEPAGPGDCQYSAMHLLD